MKSYKSILKRMKEKFIELSGFEFEGSSDIGTRMRLLAKEIFAVYSNLDWLKRQVFPQTAENLQLDLHAQQRGLFRKRAMKSAGTLKFKRSSALDYDIVIPKGCICAANLVNNSEEGQSVQTYIKFETVEEKILKAGEVEISVPAQSLESGAQANVNAKTITVLVDPPAGISSVINLEKFTGGTDAENDTKLRERLLDSYKNISNGTNCAFYKKTVLAYDGVHSVSVLPRERGRGTVDIYVAAQGSVPQAELIQKIDREINELREINVDIKVFAAKLLNISLEVEIEVKPGYSFGELKESCEAAMRSYFYSLEIGEDIRLCALGNIIFGIEGVFNYSFKGSLVQDKILDKKQLAVLKSISITQK
jgi:uncharacterized phage protein gp47/JayE